MKGRAWVYNVAAAGDGYTWNIQPPTFADWDSVMLKGTLPEEVAVRVDGLLYACAPLAWWEWLALEQGYKRPLLGGVVIPLPRHYGATRGYDVELIYSTAGRTKAIFCRRPTDARQT